MAWNSHPQSCEPFLYLYRPAVVFAARVNAAAASYPLASIPYDGVTTGSIAAVQMGMTVLIGSTAGASDRGRSYVRAENWAAGDVGTASALYIGYSAQGSRPGEIDLVDDSYITVLDLYEVWTRPSRMLASGVIKKDYDWDVSGYAHPILQIGGGLARIGFVDTVTDVLALSWDASSSPTVESGASWLWKAWDVADGAITAGAVDEDAISVEFAAGARWIKLDGMDSNVSPALPRRQLVVALDGESDAGLVPTLRAPRWRCTPEGVTLTVEVRERLDPADVPAGTVALLLTRQITAGSETLVLSFAGFLSEIGSSGVGGDYDLERVTTLTCVDVAGRLAQLRGAASQAVRVTLSTNHNEMTDADLERYVWWELYWHTSAPILADYVPGGTNYPFSSFSQAGGSRYACADTLAQAIGYRLTAGFDGVLRLRADPLRQIAGARTSTVQRDIQPADIARIERVGRAYPPVGLLRVSAWLTSTTNLADRTTEQTQVFAVAPGTVAGQAAADGSISSTGTSGSTTVGGALATSEYELRQRTGQDYARANNPEETLRITLNHGNDAGLRPELLEWVTLTTDSDTVGWADEALTAARCLLTAVEFTVDVDGSWREQAIEVERETVGTVAARDPEQTNASSGTQVSEPTLAPVTVLRSLLTSGQDRIGGVTRTGYLVRTGDFTAATPTWTALDLSTGTVDDVLQDPFELSSLLLVGTAAIFRVTGANATPGVANVFNFRSALAEGLRAIQYERGTAGFAVVASNYADGCYVTRTLDGGANWSAEIRVGAAVDLTGAGRAAVEINAHSGAVYVAAHDGTRIRLYKSTDSAASFAVTSDYVYETTEPSAGAILYSALNLRIPWDDPGRLYHAHVDTNSTSGPTDSVPVVCSTAGTSFTLETYYSLPPFPRWLGPENSRWGLKNADSDADKLLIAANRWSGGGGKQCALYRSLDGGATLDEVVAAFYGDSYRGCAIGGDTLAGYVWGNTGDSGSGYGDTGIWYAAPFATFTSGDLTPRGGPGLPANDTILNIFGWE